MYYVKLKTEISDVDLFYFIFCSGKERTSSFCNHDQTGKVKDVALYMQYVKTSKSFGITLCNKHITKYTLKYLVLYHS